MRACRGARRDTAKGVSSGRCSERHSACSISVLPVLVGDRRAVVLEHVIQVQAEAIAGGRDPRIDDVEPELVEHRGGAREPMAARRA